MYSSKSSSGASKSGATYRTVSFIVPSFRSAGRAATSFATGFWFRFRQSALWGFRPTGNGLVRTARGRIRIQRA